MTRNTVVDHLIYEIDFALRTLFTAQKRSCLRPSPAQTIKDTSLPLPSRTHSAGLLRVDHAGEICAQGLYRGQAFSAKSQQVEKHMKQAAAEESAHLAWCEERLEELSSRTSVLNALWYGTSFLIGSLVGLIGDKVSLGFVAETERQVYSHLQNHLDSLPKEDKRSRAILDVMKDDEASHATQALESGGIELPVVVKYGMRLLSKVMTKSSYYL
jgi:ubiquinone biosynthesis monooxygenase Coq7